MIFFSYLGSSVNKTSCRLCFLKKSIYVFNSNPRYYSLNFYASALVAAQKKGCKQTTLTFKRSSLKILYLFVKYVTLAGLVDSCVYVKKTQKMEIFLRYSKQRPVVNNIKIYSKPSNPKYYSAKQLSKVLRMSEPGCLVLVSTSKGILSGKSALKENVGGCLLCKIW